MIRNQKSQGGNNTTLSASPNSAPGLFPVSSQITNLISQRTFQSCPNCERTNLEYKNLSTAFHELVSRISNLEQALSEKNMEIEILKAQN